MECIQLVFDLLYELENFTLPVSFSNEDCSGSIFCVSIFPIIVFPAFKLVVASVDVVFCCGLLRILVITFDGCV